MAKLVIERGRKWEASELQPKTIALDGAVEGPLLDSENEIFSFDHHGECVRGVTLATCEQVRDFLLLGLDVTGYTVLLNDIDLDSALSAWLIEYPSRASEPMIDKLITCAGRQDAHAGAYPISKDMQDILDWIAGPEIKMRRDKTYHTAGPDVLQIVLEAIWRRIEQYADGKVPSDISQKTSDAAAGEEEYEIIKKGTGWKMVKANSERPLRGLARDNVNRFVVIKELEHEIEGEKVASLQVTVGKRSEVITGFPVGPADQPGTILAALNDAEPDRDGKTDDWGGSTTIGGSPRNESGVGSMLSIDDIFNIIERVITGKASGKEQKSVKRKKK